MKSFELYLDSNVGSPEGKVLCVHVSFLISHFHAPVLASYSLLHLCLSCQLRNPGGRGRSPPHRLPPDFSSQCLIHSPLLTRATLSRPALGSLGTERGRGWSELCGPHWKKEKTSCVLGWSVKHQQWAFALTQAQIVDEIVTHRWNLPAKQDT